VIGLAGSAVAVAASREDTAEATIHTMALVARERATAPSALPLI